MTDGLKEFIRTVPDYPVEGINFWDINSLFAGPKYIEAINTLAEKCSMIECPTHIAGIESRGFVIGAAVAYALNIPFIMIRKEGAKYPGELYTESYELEYGTDTLVLQKGLLGHTSRVVIADDLVATGGSMLASQRLIEQTGAKALAGIALIRLHYAHTDEFSKCRFDVYSCIHEHGV